MKVALFGVKKPIYECDADNRLWDTGACDKIYLFADDVLLVVLCNQMWWIIIKSPVHMLFDLSDGTPGSRFQDRGDDQHAQPTVQF